MVGFTWMLGDIYLATAIYLLRGPSTLASVDSRLHLVVSSSACSPIPPDSWKGRVLMSLLELIRMVTGGGKMENLFPSNLEGSGSEVQVWAGHTRLILNLVVSLQNPQLSSIQVLAMIGKAILWS